MSVEYGHVVSDYHQAMTNSNGESNILLDQSNMLVVYDPPQLFKATNRDLIDKYLKSNIAARSNCKRIIRMTNGASDVQIQEALSSCHYAAIPALEYNKLRAWYTTNLPNIPSLDVFIEPDHRPRPQNDGIHFDNAVDRTTAQMEWALDNGRLISARSAQTCVPTCLDCNGKLKFTKAHLRTVRGVQYDVCAFFSHQSRTKCGGETSVHKAAKMVEDVAFFDECRSCKSTVPIVVEGRRVPEYTFTASDGHIYRPDVALLDQGGEICGAIEVMMTHAMPTSKCEAYNKSELAWVEVDAISYLRAFEKREPVHVLRSSFEVLDRLCSKCTHAEDEARIQRELKRKRQELQEIDDIKRRRRELDSVPQLIPLVEQFFKWFDTQLLGPLDECLANILRNPDWEIEGILPWGKHKGNHIRQVWEHDPNYVFWMKKTALSNGLNASPAMLDIMADLCNGTCETCKQPTGEDWKTLCSGCYRATKYRR